MEGIEVIFWIILALIWLISGSLLRKRARRERERMHKEGEGYTKPEEGTEGMFPEEEVREVFELPPIILPPVKEPEVTETPELEKVPEGEVAVPLFVEPIPEGEELEIELKDLETLGQGILLSEILGPPRSKKPFRGIR